MKHFLGIPAQRDISGIIMKSAEQPSIPEQFDRYLRIYNDTATWLAETLDGSMLTPFEYTYRNGELYAEDGSAIGAIFCNAERDAIEMAARDPRLAFEPRRRRHESGEYADMLAMARGEQPNTKVVVSDFPVELMTGKADVGGYNVTRKQTMLRVLAWDGRKLTMYSQSLDGSDRQALEAIYSHFGIEPQPGELLGQRISTHCTQENQKYLTSRLTGVYDRSLSDQYGGRWYAGREDEPHDTYQFVLSQHALIDHFATRFMHHDPTDQDRYNLAALMEQRFDAFKRPRVSFEAAEIAFAAMRSQDLDWQLQQAGSEARAAGKTFSGCGISVGIGNNSPDDQLGTAGYGNKAELEDKFGSLTFTCTKGHTNTRPYGRLIPSCRRCGEDISCKELPKQQRKTTEPFSWKTLTGLGTDYTDKNQPKNKAAEVGRKVLLSV